MKLLRPLPPELTYAQLEHHYQTEKALADRLKSSTREERKLIYSTMYGELFERVPYHSRLIQRNDARRTHLANRSKLMLVRGFLRPSTVFAEFAPGDCKFAMEVASAVKTIYGIDISDQRDKGDTAPDNFKLIIYDGYRLEGIPDNSVDLIFSDQLIEHLHPEDTRLHFMLVYRLLKPGGRYILRTPHALSGPHDISRFFSNEPQGFHLKEWTYLDIGRLLKTLDFSRFQAIWKVKSIRLRLPYVYFWLVEPMLRLLPTRYRRLFARYLVPSLCIAVIK